MMLNPASPSSSRSRASLLSTGLELLLIGLIAVGIFYRFAWVNWNQDAQLHPDEYGLTNTLSVLRMPTSLAEYFNTRISPISPYHKYNPDGSLLQNGPDNRMRWGQLPMILIRAAAEATGNTGYGELRLLGRRLSALADALAIGLLYLIGRKLYNHRIALTGAALSALAVMQIQQSHFMTVDNFGTFFTMLALYAAVRIAQQPPLARRPYPDGAYRLVPAAAGWFALFGAAAGMALACKINLLPLIGMVVMAAFLSITDLKLRFQSDLSRIFGSTALLLVLSAFSALLAFRLTQPMSSRAPQGDTTFFTLHLNQDWVDSMQVAQMESSGIGGGPPGEQWAARPAILFPLMNMVVWGMGLPFGLTAWLGFGLAGWQVLRKGLLYRAHLIPLVWVGGYFLFMGTRWVKSIRYFLPIYPLLALLAAWLLWQVWQSAGNGGRGAGRLPVRRLAAGGLMFFVLGGTLIWADAFVSAVYRQPHTRLQATEWIFQNIPAPVHFELQTAQGSRFQPVSVPDGLTIPPGERFTLTFTARESGTLRSVTLPRLFNPADSPAQLRLSLYREGSSLDLLTETSLQVPPASGAARGNTVQADLSGGELQAGQVYTLTLHNPSDQPLKIYRLTLANESWDEGLPVPRATYDPFGDFYRGVTMEVRWYDDENKRQMFYERLAEVDYIILPSQRGIWSVARLQLTYPMTIEYYRALFDGRLGFDLAAHFQAPWRIGNFYISDVGGQVRWGAPPRLPLFNFNFFAAEEAFSVYDHPPVWIFVKSERFDMAQVRSILGKFDLSQVVVQSPRDARPRPIQ
uniref:Phospholipid carrier-dependent glycosyltransferase n=1 Tax=Bellilinea caldifistulae TaxID=360411 RepID=A0A7C4Q553_9CHLR